jgi:ADP-heptose:LPS heptosyltransferase
MKSARTVAIVRSDHIGDLVLTTPAIRALSRAGWMVDVIAPRGQISLLRGNPHIREITVLQDISPRWPADWWRLAMHLRRRRYEALIIPFAHPRRLLLASALSGASRRIAMWAGLPGRLTGHICVRSRYFEEPRPYARTAQLALGPLGIDPDGIEPELFISSEESLTISTELSGQLDPGIRIGIHPACLGNTCNLPLSTYQELASLILSRTDWKIVITGSKEDEKTLAAFRSLAETRSRRLWVAAGRFDLRQMAALLGELDAFVVPSTGPLHIAKAVGAPTLTPFCPQIPVCAAIWGHEPLGLSALEPDRPPCDRGKIHDAHCDFQGSITAADLFARLERLIQFPAVSLSTSD